MDRVGTQWTADGPLDRWVPPEGPADADLQRLIHTIRHRVPSGDGSRVSLVEELVDRDNRQPWSLAVQASVYEGLKHPVGAWLSANRAANILHATSPAWSDPAFKGWLDRLRAMAQAYETEQLSVYDRIGQLGFRFAPPVKDFYSYRTSNVDASQLHAEWDHLAHTLSPTVRAERYARLMAVENGELENVFHLAPDARARLVRAGFYKGAIERFLAHSPILSKQHVVEVLADYQKALEELVVGYKSRSRIDVQLMLDIHRRIVASTRVQNGALVPVREFRRLPVYVGGGGPSSLAFHRHDQIQHSITTFLDLAVKVDATVDSYAHAAWIHHSFICIHPFVDGNGRTARLLASIPLMLAGLPPLNVLAEDSREYYAALTTADTDRDLRPLATFLRDQSLKTISTLGHIERDKPARPAADTAFDMSTESGDLLAAMHKANWTGPIGL